MNYIKEVIFTAIICGIVSALSSIGTNGSKKFVKFICSIAFICVLLSPLTGDKDRFSKLMSDIDNIEITEQQTTEYDEQMMMVAKEICNAAVHSAAEKFNVPENCFKIKLYIDTNNQSPTLDKALVYTSGNGDLLDKVLLKEYFAKILNCSIEVITDENNKITQ